MKANLKSRLLSMTLAIAMIFSMGAFGAMTVSAAATVTAIVLSGDSVSIEQGSSATITATATDADESETFTVDWCTSAGITGESEPSGVTVTPGATIDDDDDIWTSEVTIEASATAATGTFYFKLQSGDPVAVESDLVAVTVTENQENPSAVTITVGNVTVTGTKDTELASSATVTLTVANDTFVAADGSETPIPVTSWFTNIPAGLKAEITATVSTGTTLPITISGTPTEAKAAAMAITVPAASLTGAESVIATSNENAKWNITADDEEEEKEKHDGNCKHVMGSDNTSYICLTYEELVVPADYTTPKSFSINGGETWKANSKAFDGAAISKMLNKAMTLHINTTAIETKEDGTKAPTDATKTITFLPTQDRQKIAEKYVVNYDIKQDATGNENHGWVLTVKDGTEAAHVGLEFGKLEGTDKSPKNWLTMTNNDSKPLPPATGTVAKPKQGKETWLIRLAPTNDAPASKAKKITVKGLAKAPKVSVDAKKSLINVKKGMTALFISDASENNPTPVVTPYADKVVITADTGTTGTYIFWMTGTAKKPPSAITRTDSKDKTGKKPLVLTNEANEVSKLATLSVKANIKKVKEDYVKNSNAAGEDAAKIAAADKAYSEAIKKAITDAIAAKVKTEIATGFSATFAMTTPTAETTINPDEFNNPDNFDGVVKGKFTVHNDAMKKKTDNDAVSPSDATITVEFIELTAEELLETAEDVIGTEWNLDYGTDSDDIIDILEEEISGILEELCSEYSFEGCDVKVEAKEGTTDKYTVTLTLDNKTSTFDITVSIMTAEEMLEAAKAKIVASLTPTTKITVFYEGTPIKGSIETEIGTQIATIFNGKFAGVTVAVDVTLDDNDIDTCVVTLELGDKDVTFDIADYVELTADGDYAAVVAEAAKYASTATIANAVKVGDTITATVMARTGDAGQGITVTAETSSEYFTIEAGVITLKKVAEYVDGLTDGVGTITLSFTKNGKTTTKNVTVTIKEQPEPDPVTAAITSITPTIVLIPSATPWNQVKLTITLSGATFKDTTATGDAEDVFTLDAGDTKISFTGTAGAKATYEVLSATEVEITLPARGTNATGQAAAGTFTITISADEIEADDGYKVPNSGLVAEYTIE